MKFEEFGLHSEVLAGVSAAGFTDCMEVQEKVLSVTLDGNDVMVQSKTGSGKTAAFVLTFLEEYLRRKAQGLESRCLIVAPTRELAQQISSDAKILSKGIKGFSVGCFYGGVGYESQYKKLDAGCNLCVGTPGRLIEFLKNRRLPGDSITTFVIDEADRLFDMGFYPDIKKMFQLLNPADQRQTMLFSATLEMRVRELAWEFMKEKTQEIDLEPDSITVDQITQELYHVAKSDKFQLFLQLLAQIKPKSAIVFTNSRHMTSEVAVRLKLNGYAADHLSGDMNQSMRDKALKNIKEGKTSILVATDVAARGLQIDDLPLVVNYDIPEDYENYVHRIGRTARAGKSGRAITLADEEFVYGLEAIEKFIKMKIPVIWPDNLPEVEDKSLGKSWREGSEKKTGPVETKTKTGVSKPSTSKPSTSQPKKSLGQMSEQERIAYYKKKYGFEPKAAPKPVAEPVKPVDKSKKSGLRYGIPQFFLLFVICIVLFALGLVPIFLLKLFGFSKAADSVIYFLAKLCSHVALFLAGADVKVSGETDKLKDLIKNRMPICYIGNHTSLLDVPVIYAPLGLKAGFIAKSSYLLLPGLNLLIWLFHSIFLKRGDMAQSRKAIRKGQKNINSGIPMMIYPEGTRSKNGRIAPFKYGSFRLATETGAVIVPITVKGLRACCEERSSFIQGKKTCYVKVGKPVQAPVSTDKEAVAKIIANVEKQIHRDFASLGKTTDEKKN